MRASRLRRRKIIAANFLSATWFLMERLLFISPGLSEKWFVLAGKMKTGTLLETL